MGAEAFVFIAVRIDRPGVSAALCTAEPETPSVKRIVEMGRQIAAALGPTLVQEMLDEFITTKEDEDEDSCRR